MRWRFVDRIEQFEPWRFIKGRKSISLEEYSLLEPFGLKGVCPESLILESFVHLARWLVVKSSNFQEACVLASAYEFAFEEVIGTGGTLNMTLVLKNKLDGALELECQARDSGQLICRGVLGVGLIDLADIFDPDESKIIWQELNGKA
jgi:3-hydroxymyristoyl/3-hydroxydecanoyl-(acyl carrier protein) dehydratase